MGRTLHVHLRAKQDVDEIADTIAEDNPDAALRFFLAARDAFGRLAEFPGTGAVREDLRSRHLKGVRSYPIPRFRKYLVFYLPTEDGVEVLRVIHGARQIEQALEES
jgi:toxin ParE1/3/4